jgi:pimeloyl-ACP methyl ester carboxylesterase
MSPHNFSRVSLLNAVLEVDLRGSGAPVVLIQTALFADEFVPLADHPSLRDDYQVIVYHRRAYAGSSPVRGDGSIVRDAVDCQFLLAELGVQRAHVVRGSYAGAVASSWL